MMSCRRYLAALALAVSASLITVSAQAAAVAAQTGVVRHSPCPSFCGGSGSIFDSDINGGEGFTTASSVVFPNAALPAGRDGEGRAEASLNGGGISLPTLRAEAYSDFNSRVSADAAAMQQYNYNGASSNFVLDVTLDGSVVSGSQPPDATLRANIIVFTAPDIAFFTDYGTMRFESIDLTPGTTILDELTLDFYSLGLFDSGLQAAMGSLAFTLNDGDQVYVWANLVVNGTRGGYADAFNTLTIEVAAGNTAGLSAVPLPAPILLLAGGAAMLGCTRRAGQRRRAA